MLRYYRPAPVLTPAMRVVPKSGYQDGDRHFVYISININITNIICNINIYYIYIHKQTED